MYHIAMQAKLDKQLCKMATNTLTHLHKSCRPQNFTNFYRRELTI